MNMLDFLGGARGLNPAELEAFLRQTGGPNNKYVNIGPYQAYVRKGMPRTTDPVARNLSRLESPLDLANVQNTSKPDNFQNLPREQRPKAGRFRELMKLLEDNAGRYGRDSVYVEQIQNEFLPELLASMGYRQDKMHALMNPDTPSMYKRLGS